MSNDQSPVEKVGNNLGKWILGTLSTIAAIVSFVNLMRGNFQLGVLIFAVLIVVNLLLLYIVFHTRPASAGSMKRIYPYQKYRGLASAGIVLLLIVVAALSIRSNRGFIGAAVRGTPIPTALPTPTALPPATTMRVTVQAGDPCRVGLPGVFQDFTRRDTLDIEIDNNSDRSLMIASVVLKPVWITTSESMRPAGVTPTYHVSLDVWLQESILLVGLRDEPLAEGSTSPPDLQQRVARVGEMIWTKPSPLAVPEITGDKLTIQANSQDRFQLILGLSRTYLSLWGTLLLELTLDNGQTLTSEPVEFAVCYEPVSPADESTATSVPAVPNPEANREGLVWSAWNDLARQEQGGVVIEVMRVVVAEEAKGLDFRWEGVDQYQHVTYGEIYFRIQNNTDTRRLLLPLQMSFQTDPESFALLDPGPGQSLNGYIEPGETKIGSLRFSTVEFSASELKSLHMDLGCAFNDLAGCSGPGFVFDLDLSTPRQDPFPEALRKVLIP